MVWNVNIFHERPAGNIARQAEPAPELWIENESAANYENWIWELVSWKTEFQNDFYEKSILRKNLWKTFLEWDFGKNWKITISWESIWKNKHLELWIEKESTANYENWIWEIVSWKTESENAFHEKLILGTSFMKNWFWERIYEKLNLRMRFREKLKYNNFLRKYMKKQIFRKMTNWNLSLKKVENTLFREFFIKYSQILDFEKKVKTRKIVTKTPNYDHHSIEKTNKSRGNRFFLSWYHRENELQKPNPEHIRHFSSDVSNIGRTSDEKCRVYGFTKTEIYVYSHSIRPQSNDRHQICKLQ